jgi:hypothetical protein
MSSRTITTERPDRDRTEAEIAPLIVIERAVQDRAKELGLNPDNPNGRAELEQLVRMQLDKWQLEFERGERTISIADPELHCRLRPT